MISEAMDFLQLVEVCRTLRDCASTQLGHGLLQQNFRMTASGPSGKRGRSQPDWSIPSREGYDWRNSSLGQACSRA